MSGQLSFPTDPRARVIRAVEVRRSARRRRTVSARLEGDRMVVLLPERLSRAEEAEWIEKMWEKFEAAERKDKLNAGDHIERRAQSLNEKYFGGRLSWQSIQFVTNQRSRYGSCTPSDGTIRISDTLAPMPSWVLDYVLVHELAHLVETSHSPAFWRMVDRYPLSERAKGFLIAKGLEEAELA